MHEIIEKMVEIFETKNYRFISMSRQTFRRSYRKTVFSSQLLYLDNDSSKFIPSL